MKICIIQCINMKSITPQVQSVHLSLTTSEEVDGGEAKYEKPDDVPP